MDDDDAADDDDDEGGGDVIPFASQDGASAVWSYTASVRIPPSVRPRRARPFADPFEPCLPCERARIDGWINRDPREEALSENEEEWRKGGGSNKKQQLNTVRIWGMITDHGFQRNQRNREV